MKTINKVALITFPGYDQDHLLLVKKRGLDFWILPGGKPEPYDMDHRATLEREVQEELGISLMSAEFWQLFTDKAAGMDDTLVNLHCWTGELHPFAPMMVGNEIEKVFWYDIFNPPAFIPIASSLKDQIIPALRVRQKEKQAWRDKL